jgi:hypothetical protein
MKNRLDWFYALSHEEKRDHILSVCENCIDGAPLSLARKIEIYLNEELDEVWMLDYLNAVFPHTGVFESEEQADAWLDKHDPTRKDRYTIFKMTVNRDLELVTKTTSPHSSYSRSR